LKAILSDFLPGTKNKFDRKFLLDALEIDEWHILLETHDKGQAEHTRAINVLLPLLQNYLGWTEEISILILDCYTTAMGWNDVAIAQKQPKPQMQTNTVKAVIDDETRELLEFVRQLKNNSGVEIAQPQQTVLTPPPVAVAPPKRSIAAAPVIGSTMKFGPYEWRVLDVQGDKALLITKDVTHVNMPYNKSRTNVWETCTLRKWLNEDFLRTFSGQEQSRIAITENVNENNQLYGMAGGNNTTDRIFLLSLSEVVKYFGDSGQLKQIPNSGYIWSFSDQYDKVRIANYGGSAACWWLRSPGRISGLAAYVYHAGDVSVSGTSVGSVEDDCGVRAALWLSL
jgi:hypothetical protein